MLRKIQHSVWPTGVPPVCTAFWDQDSWRRFDEGFRPAGYTGGQYDEEAWAIFDAARREAVRQELLAKVLGRSAE